MGVNPKTVDLDLQRSLKLGVTHGALVQDVTPGSPADRAGVQVYDVIVGLDDQRVATDDQLIREVAGRAPGNLGAGALRPPGPRADGHAEA